MSASDDEKGDGKSSTFEMICGLTLAVLAAILAITDLGAGKYGADEIIAHNQKAMPSTGIRPRASKSPWWRANGTCSNC